MQGLGVQRHFTIFLVGIYVNKFEAAEIELAPKKLKDINE